MIDIFNTDEKFNVIYADPPWSFKNKNTGGSMSSGSKNQYDVMSIKEICDLPIKKISKENAVLFMWWVASMPNEAIKVVESWGFELKTMTAFTWIKKTKNWKDFFGMGFYTRQQCEQCLVAIKGKPKILNHSTRQIIRAKNLKHSKKPDETRDKIISMYGNNNNIELFAREYNKNWSCWGNQLDIWECINDNCNWIGQENDTVHYKNDSKFLCPECNEVVEKRI